MGVLDSVYRLWAYIKLFIIATVAFFVANVRTEDGMTALLTAGSVVLVSYFAV